MNESRYRHNAGSVFSLKYHLVRCPKYRRKVLVGEIAEELHSLLNQKAQELDMTIEALEIMPDHVHLLIQRFPTESPHHLGKLRQKFPQLRSRLPSLWSSSFYVGTIGHVYQGSILRTIAMQKSR